MFLFSVHKPVSDVYYFCPIKVLGGGGGGGGGGRGASVPPPLWDGEQGIFVSTD